MIILSAALDLVPPSTPKGIIAFCNIFPALLAKLGWPYLLKGRIRYVKRLVGCTAISVGGMMVSTLHPFLICVSSSLSRQVVSLFDGLYMRLLGICFASFSSGVYAVWIPWSLLTNKTGLGELTFLQLSTRYHPPSVAGHSVRSVPILTCVCGYNVDH